MSKGFIRSILLPKEDKFFPLFEDLAELVAKGGHLLMRILESERPCDQEDLFREIKTLETKADDVVHGVMDSLDRTFLTPFDREDIQRLVARMDDVMDHIHAASQQIKLYQPARLIPDLRDLGLIMVRGCEQLRIAVFELRNLKKPVKIQDACIRMNELENAADDKFHQLISELFDYESNPIELIKNKKILETLEAATDRIEDVSDILKTILIKNA